ncbi:GFA family protein [Streptomyces colonosanans]|uniref:GFA family protein n=1 Tax=Streptomyces colonosanans TaxID=1428652 RepID=UPI0009A0DAE7|nr:GFA family protein [Streptomyces colonosanans]
MSPAPPDHPAIPTDASDLPDSDAALVVGTAEPKPKVRTGRCLCGDTVYEVDGAPDDPHLCSCRHETRVSGGPAVLWVGFRKDRLRWVGPGGEPTWYSSWPTLHRGFCPRCGSQLVSVADGSDMIMVTGFSLDDRSGTDPVGHSYREEAVPWMTIALAPDPFRPQPASM